MPTKSKIDDEARDIMKDSFAHDMAKHQRMTGKEPTCEENAQLAKELFERIEREQSEAKHVYEAPVKADEKERKFSKDVLEKGYRVIEEEDQGTKFDALLKLDKFEADVFTRMNARVQLLLSKLERGPLNSPSWCERVLAAQRTGMIDKKRGQLELIEVLEASNIVFGDWKKDPAKKLFSHA